MENLENDPAYWPRLKKRARQLIIWRMTERVSICWTAPLRMSASLIWQSAGR